MAPLVADEVAVAVAFATSDTSNWEADATADEAGLEFIISQICVAMSEVSEGGEFRKSTCPRMTGE